MKIGVFAVLFGEKPFEETLDYLKAAGVDAVEIGCGAYPGDAHCQPAALLADEGKLKAFKQAVERRGLVISALSCHGNPIHPQKTIAADHHRAFEQTVRLARARRRSRRHLQRLPGRRSESGAAELDRGAVAARIPRHARVAVEGARAAVLEGRRAPLQGRRRQGRDRNAPQLRRLQPGDDDAAAGDRAGDDRLQLRSEPHVLAGHRSGGGDPRARRLHLSLPREGLQDRRAEHRGERRARRQALHRGAIRAPGSSARSGTATAPTCGRTSSARCGWSATITCSASSTRTA